MKRLTNLFAFLILFASCNSNDTSVKANEPSEVITDKNNFYALTIGNSWVYKNYRLNKDTNTYDLTPVVDSVSIVSTENINGNTYFKFRRWTTGNETKITFCNPNGEHLEFLRDSSGYLINETGKIKHTHVDYNERLFQDNNWGNIYEILLEGTEELSVEAGTFNCVSSKRYAKDENDLLLPAKDFFYYSDGFGLIYDTQSFVSNEIPTIIRRLDSYDID